jgi:hypothetical protein
MGSYRGDLKDYAGLTVLRRRGATTIPSNAEMENIGALAPAFVAWIMGFPAEWLNSVDWEMPLFHNSRRRS